MYVQGSQWDGELGTDSAIPWYKPRGDRNLSLKIRSLVGGGVKNLLPQQGYVLKELSVNYVGSSRLVVELMTSPPTLKANDVCK